MEAKKSLISLVLIHLSLTEATGINSMGSGRNCPLPTYRASSYISFQQTECLSQLIAAFAAEIKCTSQKIVTQEVPFHRLGTSCFLVQQ